jgi:hypothetical protein
MYQRHVHACHTPVPRPTHARQLPSSHCWASSPAPSDSTPTRCASPPTNLPSGSPPHHSWLVRLSPSPTAEWGQPCAPLTPPPPGCAGRRPTGPLPAHFPLHAAVPTFTLTVTTTAAIDLQAPPLAAQSSTSCLSPTLWHRPRSIQYPSAAVPCSACLADRSLCQSVLRNCATLVLYMVHTVLAFDATPHAMMETITSCPQHPDSTRECVQPHPAHYILTGHVSAATS